MSKVFLDITSLYNHRMVFPESTSIDGNKEIGDANCFIFSESVSFEKVIEKGDVKGMFRQRLDGLDNVVCDSQVMMLDGLSIKKITFIGFCTWGYFKENFELECVDQTVEYAKAYFSDIAWPLEKIGEGNYIMEKALYNDGSRYFTEVKIYGGTGIGYLYHYTTEFSEEKKIKKIIFPQNCSMHIFAITIEN